MLKAQTGVEIEKSAYTEIHLTITRLVPLLILWPQAEVVG